MPYLNCTHPNGQRIVFRARVQPLAHSPGRIYCQQVQPVHCPSCKFLFELPLYIQKPH